MLYIYILECSDGTLYTGYTNDIKKRLAEHNGININTGGSVKTGAKYTKARRPVTLKYSESYSTKSEAMRREAQIKKLTRTQKIALFYLAM